MKPVFKLQLLVACFFATACEQAAIPVEAPAQAVGTEAVVRTGHYSTPWVFDEQQMPKEERDALSTSALKATVAIFQIIGDAANWQEAHASMKDFIKSDTETPSYLREQMASVRMLDRIFETSDRSPEALDAIAYYTEFLVEHRTPEGGLLVQALRALEKTWSPEKVAEAAARGVEGMDAYFSKRFYCEGCSGKKGGLSSVPIEGVAESDDAFLIQLEQARDQLKAMSTL